MSAPESATRRELGVWTAAALVVASMIGTGVFTTSGFLLASLHSPWVVLAAWAVGGVQAALGALCYGALARRLPESGGEYLFLSRTLHPAAGFVAGWLSLLVGFSAPLAGAAFAFGEYTRSWWPDWPPKLAGTLLILAFSAVHAWHVRRGAWLQNAAVLLKIGLIAGFAALAWPRLPDLPAVEPAGSASVGAFAVALVWISFSYAGWNAAVYIGGEVRDAERTLPRALLLGTGVVTALYLALNHVFVHAAPVSELAGKLEVGRLAAAALGGPAWAEAITALVAVALVSSVSSLVMAGPRVYAQMAADGCVPRIFAAPAGPPRTSIALQAGVALALLWSATFEALLTYIGFTLSLSTAATVAGLMRLRRREGPQLPVPGWPWVPGLFLLSVLAMTGFTVARQPRESLLGLATMAVGWVAWWWQQKRSASPA